MKRFHETTTRPDIITHMEEILLKEFQYKLYDINSYKFNE